MSEPPPREPEDDRTPVPVRERGDGYFRNGEWVPREEEPDPRPPGWWDRCSDWLDARLGTRWQERRWWLPAAGVLLALLVFLVVIGSASRPAAVPRQQNDFLAAVARGQQAVRAGNDLTLVTARRARALQLCHLLPDDLTVTDWIGKIGKVGTVFGSEQGFLFVSLGEDVELKTSNHHSEDGGHTLIEPSSTVYGKLAELAAGDEVRFSGTFVRSRGSCVHETSLRSRNGMLTPDFLFDFTSVEPR